MLEEILKAIPIYFSCMVKFILGPTLGYAFGLNLITTILTTVLGMMTVVVIFTYFADWIKAKFGKSLPRFRKKSPPNPRYVALWKKYGLPGVAMLTPIILTPIGGTLLAISSGSPREKIIIYMFISAAVWSVVFSMTIYFFGNEVLPEFVK